MDNKVGPKSDPPSDGEAMGFRGLSQYQTEYSTTRQLQPMASAPPLPGMRPVPWSYNCTNRNTAPGIGQSTGKFPPNSFQTTCSRCQETVTTKTQESLTANGIKAYCILILTCTWCLLFCLDFDKDTIHYCPRCKNEIGRYNAYANPRTIPPGQPTVQTSYP